MNDGSQIPYDGIVLAEKSATQVLTTVLEKLSSRSEAKEGGPTRLFFPNGVELISIVVKVGPSTGIDIELTVSGDKADKPISPTP